MIKQNQIAGKDYMSNGAYHCRIWIEHIVPDDVVLSVVENIVLCECHWHLSGEHVEINLLNSWPKRKWLLLDAIIRHPDQYEY